MKQTTLSFLLMLLPIVANADAVEIDGIYYNLIPKGNAAEVTSNPNNYMGEVTIPKTVTYNDVACNVTSICKSAFYGCSGLTSVTIPNSVTSIGNYAFEGCSGLTSITIPNSVTSIGNSAFEGCSGLTSITIGSSVTSIGSKTFHNCSGLKSIIIPNSVTSLGNYAFSGCSGLTSITIPNSVTSIGDYAFRGCSGLTNITIPNSVTSIGNSTFQNCSGLTNVIIPNSMTTIGNSAFSHCSGLTSITIPNSVTSIEDYAFSGCPELTDIYCFATNVPSTDDDAFQNSYIEYATLHVPESSLEKYKTTAPWSSIQNIVSIESDGQLFDMTVNVSNAFGKVTYGTIDITDGQQTFNVKEGSDVILTLTPNDGYKVNKVAVNGEDKTADVVDGQLTLNNVTDNLTVNVCFGVAGDNATVTIGTAGIVTFCPADDVDFTSVSGVKAYIGSIFNRETGVLTMTRAYDVPAGTGLLIKGELGTYEIPYKQSHSIVSNLLKGVTTETILAPTDGGNANYVLVSGSNGTGFYRVPTEGTTLAAGRAYLTIPAETAASRSALRLAFDDEEEATGIDASLTNSEERIVNSAVYDLQGRRVEYPQPGLYIRNGKKVIIK